MSVEKKTEVEKVANSCRVAVEHVARGTYPVLDHTWMPLNRFFIVLDNPGGRGNYIEGAGERHELQVGRIYFTPSYLPTVFALDERLLFISIQARIEFVPEVDLFSNCKRIFTVDRPEIVSQAEKIFTASNPLIASVFAYAVIWPLAAHCLTMMTPNEWQFFPSLHAYREVLAFIEHNCHAGVRVEQMAKIMHMSRENFTRKFTADIGLSPKFFFNQYLVRRAMDLLKEEAYSVQEVAFQLNFNNEYYFSRFFKTHTGVTPGWFRRYRHKAGVPSDHPVEHGP
jgi:AraC-like DNA-binding protein